MLRVICTEYHETGNVEAHEAHDSYMGIGRSICKTLYHAAIRAQKH